MSVNLVTKICYTVTVLLAASLSLTGCFNRCDITPHSPAWQKNLSLAPDVSMSVIQSADGGFVIGKFATNPYYGPPALLKTDENGQELWTIALADAGFSNVHDVVEVNETFFLVAGRGVDADIIARVDNSGDLVWSDALDDTQGDFGDIRLAATSDGYAVMAYSTDTPPEIKIVKIDSEGTTRWSKTLDVVENDSLEAMVPTADGGVTLLSTDVDDDVFGDRAKLTPPLLSRSRLTRFSVDGSELWNVLVPREDFSFRLIAPGPDDSVVLLSFDDDLTVFDSNGQLAWTKGLNAQLSRGLSYSLSPLRRVPGDGFALGHSSSSIFRENCGNCTLIRTNDTGDVIWDREYGTAAYEALLDFTPTEDGGYAIVGVAYSEMNGGEDSAFLMKVAPE